MFYKNVYFIIFISKNNIVTGNILNGEGPWCMLADFYILLVNETKKRFKVGRWVEHLVFKEFKFITT